MPSTYNYSGGDTQTVSSPQYGSYTYRPGESQDSYIKENLMDAHRFNGKNLPMAFSETTSGGVAARMFQGRSIYKRQQAEYEEKMREYQQQLAQRDYSRYQEQVGRQNLQTTQSRNNAIQSLDDAFHSPARVAGENATYDANLKSQVAGINYNYGQSSQAAGLEAARRGQLGGSTDAEAQAGLKSNAQQQTLDAQNNAQDQEAALQDQDTQQYQALRQALLSGDPQSALLSQASAQGNSDAINRILQGSSQSDQQRLITALGLQNTVGTIGRLANAGATGVYAANGNPQYGSY